MHTGRNDPCPCGSGKKFKKCCGRAESISTPPEISRADAMKALDRTLTERMMRFSAMRLGREWLKPALDLYTGFDQEAIDDEELQLAMPWAIFDYPLPGHGIPLVQLYADDKPARVSADMHELLDAHLAAWLSIWEVQEVERGVGALIADLLTGEERFVHEVSGTAGMDVRSAILGRVVDCGGISFLGGVHPQPLPPYDADIVVREAKRICRVRTRPVRREKLQDPAVQLLTIQYWRESTRLLRARPRPTLTNTDGDLLAPTIDHFDVVTPDQSLLLARLASFPGAEKPERDERHKHGISITITKRGNARLEWDNTIIGRIVIVGTRMRVESNSVRRADSLRNSLVSHLGGLVKYRLRDETDQEELWRLAEALPDRDRRRSVIPQTDEMTAIAREYRERHMSAWPDMELPALGGLTPREAARRPGSRAMLETLLREFEMHEARLPEGERLDLDKLRDTLGMLEQGNEGKPPG